MWPPQYVPLEFINFLFVSLKHLYIYLQYDKELFSWIVWGIGYKDNFFHGFPKRAKRFFTFPMVATYECLSESPYLFKTKQNEKISSYISIWFKYRSSLLTLCSIHVAKEPYSVKERFLLSRSDCRNECQSSSEW